MAPAGRALAFATAIAVVAAQRTELRARARRSPTRGGPPVIRDTRSSNCCETTPAPILRGSRACQTERPDRHPQRPRLQRLRHGRPSHLHQRRRAVRRPHAERDHRRVRARDRSLRPAAICCGCARNSPAPTASIIALLAGVGAAVAGARSVAALAMSALPRSWRRNRVIQRSLLACSHPHPEDQADHAGVGRRPPLASPPAACSNYSSGWATRRCLIRATSIPIYKATRCRPSMYAALEVLAKASPYFDHKIPELQLRHDI